MKIAHKLLLGTAFPAGLIAWVGHHASAVSEDSLREAIERDMALRAGAVADELAHVLGSRVSECLSYTHSAFVHDVLSESNRHFAGEIEDVDDYLAEQNALWRKHLDTEPLPMMRRVREAGLARDMRVHILDLGAEQDTPVFEEVFVTNSYGAIVAETDLTPDYRYDDRVWWQEAKKNGVYVSDVVFEEETARHMIAICVSVGGTGAESLGVLRAELNILEVKSIMDKRSLDPLTGERTRLYLFTRGSKLIHRGGLETPAPLSHGLEWFSDLGRELRWTVHTTERLDRATESYMLSTYAVSRGHGAFPGLGWIILLELDRDEVLAPVRELGSQIQIISVAAILFVLVIGGVSTFRLSRRIAGLGEAAVAMGQGSFDEQVETEGNDEIAQLGRFFNETSRELKRTTQEANRQTVSIRAKNRMLRQEIGVRRMVERQLTEAKEASEIAERAKSDFLANMSHEIRTPMNGITGMTEFLLETELDEDQRGYAKTVSSCAKSLLALLNDILDFSKIEAGKLEFEDVPFDLGETVEEVMDILATRSSDRGLELVNAVSPDVPRELRGDPGRLRQVLTNLIGNAIKFTEDGQVVVSVVAVQEEEDQVFLRFEVMDSGIGIPQDRIDRLFQSFSQVDASTTRKYGGTGLGLAISKRLVELMEGQIGVESVEGQGSTFWFTACFDKQTALPSVRRVDLSGLRVMLIDDNDASREVTAKLLVAWGCIPYLVEPLDAVAGLRTAMDEGEPYGVVLIACEGGLGLGESIQDHVLVGDTPVVLALPVTAKEATARARELGFAGLLTKPLKQSRLQVALRRVVGRGQLEEEDVAPGPEPQAPSPLPPEVVTSLRVLVAEDNPVNQLVSRKMLEGLGVSVEVVENGLEALEAVQTSDYDLVLMDCQMPEMDGFAATKEIRTLDEPCSRIPIVALTANAMKGDREACLAAGMDDYLAKPFSKAELSEVLARRLADRVPQDAERA